MFKAGQWNSKLNSENWHVKLPPQHINHLKNETLSRFTKVSVEMCDEFICSDSGVGLCDDDRKLLESLGSKKSRQSDKPSDQAPEETDNNNNNNVEETNRNIDKDQGSQLVI